MTVSEKFNYLNILPLEVICNIINYLPPDDVANVSKVSKLLLNAARRVIISNLKKFPQIGEREWKAVVDLNKCGLSFEGMRSFQLTDAYPFIMKIAANVERNAGVTIFSVPKGLTTDILTTISSNPKCGNKTGFFFFSDSSRSVCQKMVKEPYIMIVSNALLHGSRGKSPADQQILLDALKCRKPTVLEISALCFLTHISSNPPVHLYPDKPSSYSRTEDAVNGISLEVGNYSDEGLDVLRTGINVNNIGVSAVMCLSDL